MDPAGLGAGDPARSHRLFYVTGGLAGGGQERQLWYLLRAMDRQRYNPGVAVCRYEPLAPYVSRLRDLGVTLYPIKRRGGALCRAARLRALVQHVRPEVIHSYSFYTNFPTWWASRGLSAVVAGSLRNDYLAERKDTGVVLGAVSSRFPKLLVANSQCAQHSAQSQRGWAAPREVEFVPNAVDLVRFPVTPMPAGDCVELAGVGRLAAQKNWEALLRALAIFDRKCPCAWRFRLCGTGALADHLRRRCKDLSLSDKVHLLGFRDDVPEILASSHVLVLSSRYEGTPNVVLEALASGRPVVATAVGDVPRLVRDRKEGHLVPTEDTDAIADRLLELVADRALLIRMGQAARKRAEEEGGPDSLVTRTLAVYRRAGWKD